MKIQVLSSAGRYHFFYFVAVIFFGSFYLVNLILAIVSMSYLEQQKTVEEENVERERRRIADEAEIENERQEKLLAFSNVPGERKDSTMLQSIKCQTVTEVSDRISDETIRVPLFAEQPNNELELNSAEKVIHTFQTTQFSN